MKIQTLLSLTLSLVTAGASDITYPDKGAYEEKDGLRFYSEISRQPWRETDDVIDGFEWSLPPAVRPAARSFIKGFYSSNPRTFPGHLLGVVDVTWREIEPEEGRYAFAAIGRRIAELKAKGHPAAIDLALLSRKPTAREKAKLAGAGDSMSTESFIHALLNTKQFLFIQ